MSPRTERVVALNETYRGFLAQLDGDFQAKQREWTAEKAELEDKLTRLRSIAHMSRWLMRKVLRKMRLSHGMGLATLVFYAWGKQIARRRIAKHARFATQRYYKQQCMSTVKLCFLAMQAFVSNIKVGCKLLQVNHTDKAGSPQDELIRGQIFALWRIAVQICHLSVMDPSATVEVSEGEERRTNLAVAPKEANSIFLRRQCVVGWRKLVHRRRARENFLNAQTKTALAFASNADTKRQAFGDTPGNHAPKDHDSGATLLGGNFQQDLCFTYWRYHVVKAKANWRAGERLVEFRERGLLGKTFSLWSRTVWMAQSQTYWKGELDRSISQIEEQRVAWEERVTELEAELARYMPNFGARVPARETAKGQPTWDNLLTGVAPRPKATKARGSAMKSFGM